MSVVISDEQAARILGALDDLRESEPEPDESWDSWYFAAFDLARQKIAGLMAAELAPLSKSYPFLGIARKHGLDYGLVLNAAGYFKSWPCSKAESLAAFRLCGTLAAVEIKNAVQQVEEGYA